jgi:hypothetical protein
MDQGDVVSSCSITHPSISIMHNFLYSFFPLPSWSQVGLSWRMIVRCEFARIWANSARVCRLFFFRGLLRILGELVSRSLKYFLANCSRQILPALASVRRVFAIVREKKIIGERGRSSREFVRVRGERS